LYVVGCMVDLTSFYQELNGSFSHAETIDHGQSAVVAGMGSCSGTLELVLNPFLK